MSMLNSGWLHQEDGPISRELGPSANSDDSGHLPEEDPEDTSAQGPALLSLGIRHQDTNHVPNWTGLQTLLQQLPPQDSDERYCLALGEDELAELRLFCVQRKQKALGQGVAHLVTPQLEGHTCEKLIFSRRCTEAEGRRWHENHFCCQGCAGPLRGGHYALSGGSPYCPSCFESFYSDAGLSLAGTLEGRASLGLCRALRDLRRAFLTRSGTREGSPDPTERKDHVSLNAVFTSRAEFPAATSSSSLETQSRRELERLETPRDPKEDASCPCPTCSSSSDSEPEGFFLGQRLPRLRKTVGSFQAEDSDTSRKHCTIC
ncbi:prickle-like protein 4 isoform 2-T4 [Callospermophilus lateralis]|uniref:prickle-like protein 4 isoform X2 n=1 Tax=Callospermophilus lateralis TaxID=76772 RepID=UPI004038AB86